LKFLYDNFDLLFDEAGSVDAFKRIDFRDGGSEEN
jgi:hypothetical protein